MNKLPRLREPHPALHEVAFGAVREVQSAHTCGIPAGEVLDMPLSLQSPYLDDACVWLRGNLHTHSSGSDGALSPEETAALYREKGYDFLGISDHDALTWPINAPNDLLMIPCVEVGGGPHILAVNVHERIPNDGTRQDVVNNVRASGGLAVLCHPNWETHFNHFPQALMESLTGYAGLEIWNGVVEFLEGSALATDRWDRLLSAGVRVWGFAHDDAHHAFAIGRAWLMVQTTERTVSSIVQALNDGRFYCSSGVKIERITVADGRIHVVAPDADRIRFYGQWGRLVHESDGPSGGYTTGGREGSYVRIECLGRGGRCAWTQPFFVVQPQTEPVPAEE